MKTAWKTANKAATQAFSALLVLAAVVLQMPTTAQAQTVWRCGEGGRTYSESPCPGGRQVNAADTRTAAQAQTARDEVKRSQDFAARMRKERLEDEKRNRAANAVAANLGPTKASDKTSEKPKAKAKPKSHRRHPPSRFRSPLHSDVTPTKLRGCARTDQRLTGSPRRNEKIAKVMPTAPVNKLSESCS